MQFNSSHCDWRLSWTTRAALFKLCQLFLPINWKWIRGEVLHNVLCLSNQREGWAQCLAVISQHTPLPSLYKRGQEPKVGVGKFGCLSSEWLSSKLPSISTLLLENSSHTLCFAPALVAGCWHPVRAARDPKCSAWGVFLTVPAQGGEHQQSQHTFTSAHHSYKQPHRDLSPGLCHRIRE